jgi:integral membrane protein
MSSPTRLFRGVAIAEAITWAGLLVGMFLKYVTDTTELGVRIFGMAHGVVFIAYVVTTLVVWTDRRWSLGRGLLALGASIPPLVTIPLERYAVGHGWLGDAWRLPAGAGNGVPDRVIAWLLRHPLRGIGVGFITVMALTGLALMGGPPMTS